MLLSGWDVVRYPAALPVMQNQLGDGADVRLPALQKLAVLLNGRYEIDPPLQIPTVKRFIAD